MASLMDTAARDLLWQRAMPSSQMALCLWASMDALVVRNSLRALLASARSSSLSTGVVMLLVLEMAAIGKMLVGCPLDMLLPPQHSPEMRCLLAEVVPLASGVE